MVIIYGPKFIREYKKLPKEIKYLAEKIEEVFRLNPFHPKLKTHKLKGKLNGLFSLSIGQKYRIIFEFDIHDQQKIYFHKVGNHDVYQ